MNNTTIRKARLKDLDALVELSIELIKYHAPFEKELYALIPSTKRKQAMRQLIRPRIYSKNALAVVAESNNRIVGYLTASIKQRAPVYKISKWGHIHQFLIKKEFRNKGIGKALFKEAERFFKQKGIKYIEVEANAKNKETKKIYKAFGLKEFEIQMVTRL